MSQRNSSHCVIHKGFPQSRVAVVARVAITGRVLGQTRNDTIPVDSHSPDTGEPICCWQITWICLSVALLLLETPCRLMTLN